MVDKNEKQKTLAKALLIARFDGDPTPPPGRRARKMGGGSRRPICPTRRLRQCEGSGHIIKWFPSVGLLIALHNSSTKENSLLRLVAIC